MKKGLNIYQMQIAGFLYGVSSQMIISWASNTESTGTMQDWSAKISAYYSIFVKCSFYITVAAIAICAIGLLFCTAREQEKMVGRIRNIIIAFIVIRFIPYAIQSAYEWSQGINGGGLPAPPSSSPGT